MPRIHPKTGEIVRPSNDQLIAQRDVIRKRMNEIESTSLGTTNEWRALDERLANIEAELDARHVKRPMPADWNEIPF